MRIVFLGLPGVGKGTQAKRLAAHLRIPHVSTGDMFRDPAILKTDIGMRAREIMQRGGLVPDDVVDGMVQVRLRQNDAKRGYVLDGYPRTLPQGESLRRWLDERGESIEMALYLDASESMVVSRISGRRSCRKCGQVYHVEFNKPKADGRCDAGGGDLYQRDDDKPEAVRTRLAVYREKTGPLVPFYDKQGSLRRIDGSGTPEDVFQRVLQALQRQK